MDKATYFLGGFFSPFFSSLHSLSNKRQVLEGPFFGQYGVDDSVDKSWGYSWQKVIPL